MTDHPVTFPDFVYLPTSDLAPGQRWSTWDDIGILAGPEPWPSWLITESAALDTELGLLKTGKEADVFLLERATEERSVVLAAKRYRSQEHRSFSRDDRYVEGRRLRKSRDRRATAKGTAYGRRVEAGAWSLAEFGFLSRLWTAGLPVPYPVQLDGTELLLELITTPEGTPAPRLAACRPDAKTLAGYWDQLLSAMRAMAAMGLTHGDLSAYNLLAAGDRIVLIDLPQAVDLVANPQGTEFLARDCRNVATWFTGHGLPVDGDELLAELISYAW